MQPEREDTMKLERVHSESLALMREKHVGVSFVLEADDDVVGVANDHHRTLRASLSPAVRPEVKHVVEVDVGEQRADDCLLRGAAGTCFDNAVLQDAGFEPLVDQTQEPLVTDTMFQESDKPLMTYRIEERTYVGVQNPVYLGASDSERDRVQRVVLATPRSESIRSSGPGGLHPEPLSEPYLSLSTHTAPII